MSANIMERLREALAAVQNFRGDLDSDDFEDVCAGLRFSATQAAPSLLAQLDARAAEITRLRAALAQAGAMEPVIMPIRGSLASVGRVAGAAFLRHFSRSRTS